MKLPGKITPDRIRDSIVQIFFTSDIPFEPLVGYFYGHLIEDGFQYSNKPLKTPFDKTITPEGVNLMEFVINPQHLFFNEEIKIQLNQNNSIVFNCINNYIGWTNYFTQIKKIVSKLFKIKIINGFSRIGIRFISEFPNIDITEHIQYKVSINFEEGELINSSFRGEWRINDFKVLINIGSRLPIPQFLTTEDKKVNFISLIDIDVISEGFSIDSTNKLFSLIDQVHFKQKETFFSLLKEEFLNTLNPEYN
jgi:uncharacterized protein (TIGR04255 family)